MAKRGWKKPLAVHAGRYGHIRFTVGSAVRAAEILIDHWPERAKQGPEYTEACRVCLACLSGECDAEAARKAFVAAAMEADILAD
ncbi:DUF982 domain-containing protein [Chelativorans sp. YIM 93263]|uniref:DUF982 domain-containing protein n=1 Tax=Chelativorans sp. YIM 93263 TaxID=2906648 RepID=UPI00237808EA|nr:DUF982 domain-containing protein [Chelativorans sp. YIM 93263]